MEDCGRETIVGGKELWNIIGNLEKEWVIL